MLGVVLVVVHFDRSILCVSLLWQYSIGYSGVLAGSAMLDLMISIVAMRGGILDVEARQPMRYLIYIRLGKTEVISKKRVSPPLLCRFQGH